MPPKAQTYTIQELAEALRELRDGVSYTVVSAKYNIARTTLYNKLTGKYALNKPSGPKTALSNAEEKRVVDYLKGMSAIGHPLNKIQLKGEIKRLLDGLNEPVQRFKDTNCPSDGWVKKFMGRHNQEITSRTPEHLGIQRAYVTEEGLRGWYKDLEYFLLREHNIVATEFFTEENANRVFNCDKIGFPLAGRPTIGHKLKEITTPEGAKNVYAVGVDSKEQITVLATASADGSFNKPMVVHSGMQERFTFNNVNREDYCLERSETGLNTDNFFEYIANHFYPEVVDNGVAFPILLFFDGQRSHINFSMATFCKSKQIIAYCFPPHASHIIQPLDVFVFGPLKQYYNESLKERARFKNSYMSQAKFIEVFDVAWKQLKAANIVKEGFRKCGLLPFDPEALDYGLLIGETRNLQQPNETTIEEKMAYGRVLKAMEHLLTNEQLELFKNLSERGSDMEPQEEFISIDKFYGVYRKITNWSKGTENVVPLPLEDSPPPPLKDSPPPPLEDSPPPPLEDSPPPPLKGSPPPPLEDSPPAPLEDSPPAPLKDSPPAPLEDSPPPPKKKKF